MLGINFHHLLLFSTVASLVTSVALQPLQSHKKTLANKHFDNLMAYSLENPSQKEFSNDLAKELLRVPQDTIDTLKYVKTKFSTYKFKDRFGALYSEKRTKSVLDLQPKNLKTNIKLDSNKRNFDIEEKIGTLNYRTPTLLTYEQLIRLREQEASKDFWKSTRIASEREQGRSQASKSLIPNIPVTSKAFKKIFGGNFVSFKTTGFVNIDLGYKRQNVANPAVPARRQANGIFDFEPHANFSVIGQIGDKLRINTSIDTKASFDFENNFKVDYTAYPEEIIQKIDVGNISFPLPTSLITGSQNLFGARTELKFGKLKVGLVGAQQRGSTDQVKLQGGGAQVRKYEIKASDYEENKHFFISQFHRNLYEPALSTPPVVNSGVLITRVEIYIMNRSNNTQTLRNIVAFQDLGEGKTFRNGNPLIGTGAGAGNPADNAANQLFAGLKASTSFRDAGTATTALNAQNLAQGTDYEVVRGSRKLDANEFIFNQQLGYISLNSPLRNDEMLGVAYEYTFNGKVYRVGELSEDYLNEAQDKVIFLKLLRPRTIRTDLPTWNLMMKNIYSLGTTGLSRTNFQLRIIYRDDISGVDNPALQEGANTKDKQLIKLFGLDELNPRGDRQIDQNGVSIGDGNFDFVDGITVNVSGGRMIFPVLEPFGSNLKKFFNPASELNLINKYTFPELYSGTRNDAQNNFANKNKFFIKGQFEGAAASASTSLPGINIAQGSVVVKAGGVLLTEGKDYTVNTSSGQVIMSDAILASGREVTISFEKSDFFQVQPRFYIGARLDYLLDKDINIGATFVNLRERPPITRVALGQEAVNNMMWGADISIKKDSRLLTRLVDALPLIQTKEKSSINFAAEVAQIAPTGSKLTGNVSYIDDFEGAEVPINLTNAAGINWKLGATPAFAAQGNPANPLEYTYNRAHLAWYNIDNSFYNPSAQRGKPANITAQDLENHYMRPIVPQEIFKNRQFNNIVTNENTFDLAYFPSERGAYNYNPAITPKPKTNGLLPNPLTNFGSITRAITSEVDFDNQNIEYVEFWLLDPFIAGERGKIIDGTDGTNGTNNTTGGDFYVNLGSISEDVMKDSKHFFENGLPIDGNPTKKDVTTWGNVPNQQYINNAFDNAANSRPVQDIGLDGLTNDEEKLKFAGFSTLNDPSADDFQYYLGESLDNNNAKIIERYKYFNNTQNNSPENTGGLFTTSATNIPDNEDLNRDNTLSELDEYYQYKISMRKNDLVVGRNYIVDKVEVTDNRITKNGADAVTWYQFRIPVREFDSKVGNINGFKSIRYIRLAMTQFDQPVVMRMAQFQLVANQWRRFLGDLNARGLQLPPEPYDPSFVVSTVNIEENSALALGAATPYDLPPGVIRDADITSINNAQLNEQSMQLTVKNLRDKDARAVYKNTNFNFRFYKNIKMYIHANSPDNTAKTGEMSAFMRIGTDFNDNYYEVEIPLTMTDNTQVVATSNRDARRELIWSPDNLMEVSIQDIIDTKTERNNLGIKNIFVPYSRNVGKYKITVVGNPDASTALIAMLGVRNPTITGDDGAPKSAIVWFNKLRTDGFDQTKGVSATARLNVQLADFANITANANFTTFGFGQLNTKIAERTTKQTLNYDVQGTFALDKFAPKSWGLRLPMLVSYQKNNAAPLFDPLDPDVKLSRSLEKFATDEAKNNYRKIVEENETRRSINFTNVGKRAGAKAKPKLLAISNFALSWSYSDVLKTDINTKSMFQQNWKTGIAYNFTPATKYWEPFAKAKWAASPWMKLFKDFNVSKSLPSIIVRYDLDRSFLRTQLRSGDLSDVSFAPFFEKYYNFTRTYAVNYPITKSINIIYSANANAVVDELAGEKNTEANNKFVNANLQKGGRMKDFTQDIGVTYKLPLDKFPATNWLGVDATYKTNYNWTAASLGLEDSLGNNMKNTRERTLRGRMDLLKLYNKVKFLKEINEYQPKRPTKKKVETPTIDPKAPKKIVRKLTKKQQKALDKKNKELKKLEKLKAKQAKKEADALAKKQGKDKNLTPKKPFEKPTEKQVGNPTDTTKKKGKKLSENFLIRTFFRTLMSFRSLNMNYTLNEGTTISGYNARPVYFGLTNGFNPQMVSFLSGTQNPDLRYEFAANNFLTANNNTRLRQNAPYLQNFNERLEFTGQLEPFRDFKITVDAKRLRTKGYQELFRYEPSATQFQSLSPVRTGTFSISIISIKTAFNNDRGAISETFEKFKEYRTIFVNRLTALNPSTAGKYTENSQDVLIGAFVAAYTGADAQKSSTNSFPKIPLPNWNINYSGLSNIAAIKKIFKNFAIKHSYNSEYRVSGYTSSLEYGQNNNRSEVANNLAINVNEMEQPLPSRANAAGNFIPTLILGQVQISERFAPVFGVDATTTDGLNFKIDYNRSRDIGLNLSNAQISEIRNNAIVLGVGYTTKNFRIPFFKNADRQPIILKNTLVMRLDFSINDTRTVQRSLTQDNVVTGGNYNFQLKPNITYTAAQNLTFQIYFERSINTPAISSSFPVKNTNFGVQVRYNLAQ